MPAFHPIHFDLCPSSPSPLLITGTSFSAMVEETQLDTSHHHGVELEFPWSDLDDGEEVGQQTQQDNGNQGSDEHCNEGEQGDWQEGHEKVMGGCHQPTQPQSLSDSDSGDQPIEEPPLKRPKFFLETDTSRDQICWCVSFCRKYMVPFVKNAQNGRVHCGHCVMDTYKVGSNTIVECSCGCGKHLDQCDGPEGGCNCFCHLLRAMYHERDAMRSSNNME